MHFAVPPTYWPACKVASMKNAKLRKHLTELPPAGVARLFSTRTLRLLAKKNIPTDYRDPFDALETLPHITKTARLRDVYKIAFDVLAESERSEYVFKNAITEKLLFGKHSPRTAALFFEFRAASCKLDALLLNGTSNAYEIKTSLDELKRLPAQISSYQKLFKNVWLITDRKHLLTAELLLPAEVGIKVLSKRYRLENIRPATSCSNFLDPLTILASLRKIEYSAILDQAGRSILHLPNTRQYEAAKTIFEAIDVNWLHDAMVRQLKIRFAQTNQSLALNIPKPLAAAALSMNLSNLDARRFIENLEKNARAILENS